jgi:hypothetical protein
MGGGGANSQLAATAPGVPLGLPVTMETLKTDIHFSKACSQEPIMTEMIDGYRVLAQD